MKNIKFREYHKEYKTMLYAQLSEHDAPLMQYTGLNDKNGEEIYENDIVEYEDDATGERYYSVVKWDEDDACYFITLDDEYNQLNGDIDYLLEVIGNIYETNLEELK